MVIPISDTEAFLKENKVKFAKVQHLTDYYADCKPLESPLQETMSGKSYYTPEFLPLDTFVLQEKFYK